MAEQFGVGRTQIQVQYFAKGRVAGARGGGGWGEEGTLEILGYEKNGKRHYQMERRFGGGGGGMGNDGLGDFFFSFSCVYICLIQKRKKKKKKKKKKTWFIEAYINRKSFFLRASAL